jgi:Flp pilus assembly protein TadD
MRRQPASQDLLRNANEQFDDGHFAEATSLARRAAAAGAGAPAHALLGYIYMSKGQLGDAERELTQAVRLNPRDGEAVNKLADVRRARAEQDE